MDILNFISWIRAGKYSPTMPADAITVVGVPNPTRGDAYLPVTVPVTAFGGSTGSNIGKLIGGGIVVAEWDDAGVKKALIASLTNLAINLPWTVPAQQPNTIGSAAESYSNGLTNTNAIIAQTGAAATIFYAAGIARLHNGGSFSDWYLPSQWELNLCYNSVAIVNKILGSTNGFQTTLYSYYWSSTEYQGINGWSQTFIDGPMQALIKGTLQYVRAVRIHTL
jgi:hypothetical protein